MPFVRMLADARPGIAAVGGREQHARERDPITDRMMDAREQDGAVADALDEMYIPERATVVERRACQVTDQHFQRGLVAGCGQRDAVEVVVGIELRIVDPVGAVERSAGTSDLPEAWEALDD